MARGSSRDRASLRSSPDRPAPGRALLLNRLGWTYWRAGPVEAALPLLERAIEESRLSSSARTLRWATHDLGVALAFLGRLDEAIALLDRTHAWAKEADDRALLMRCYINLPAVRQSRGDPTQPLVEMVDEGLRMARRSAAANTVVWLAANQAEFMMDLGRLDDALAYQDEAILNARIVGAEHLPVKLRARAEIQRLRGEAGAAASDLEEAEQLGRSSSRKSPRPSR